MKREKESARERDRERVRKTRGMRLDHGAGRTPTVRFSSADTTPCRMTRVTVHSHVRSSYTGLCPQTPPPRFRFPAKWRQLEGFKFLA